MLMELMQSELWKVTCTLPASCRRLCHGMRTWVGVLKAERSGAEPRCPYSHYNSQVTPRFVRETSQDQGCRSAEPRPNHPLADPWAKHCLYFSGFLAQFIVWQYSRWGKTGLRLDGARQDHGESGELKPRRNRVILVYKGPVGKRSGLSK